MKHAAKDSIYLSEHGLKVALIEPQIPQNCGNIARTCSVTGTELLLCGELGFSLEQRYYKRAGLDYHDSLVIQQVQDLDSWLDQNWKRLFFFSSKATTSIYEANYANDSILAFGSETSGLPQKVWDRIEADPHGKEKLLRIPMRKSPDARCLNLATSAGICLFEALRKISSS